MSIGSFPKSLNLDRDHLVGRLGVPCSPMAHLAVSPECLVGLSPCMESARPFGTRSLSVISCPHSNKKDIYIYIYIYTYITMCAYIYIYMYICIHTYTYRERCPHSTRSACSGRPGSPSAGAWPAGRRPEFSSVYCISLSLYIYIGLMSLVIQIIYIYIYIYIHIEREFWLICLFSGGRKFSEAQKCPRGEVPLVYYRCLQTKRLRKRAVRLLEAPHFVPPCPKNDPWGCGGQYGVACA